MPDFIHAVCCAPPDRPGAAHVTGFTGHLEQKVRCSTCGIEYSVDYNPSDPLHVANFEERLLAEAQKAINASHPKNPNGRHPIFVDVSNLP
jgi:hypothetical protein